jgi:hypothetical protein
MKSRSQETGVRSQNFKAKSRRHNAKSRSHESGNKRALTRSPSTPVILTILCLEVWPERISIREIGMSSVSARNLLSSRFAAPPTGGLVMRILRALPWIPRIAFSRALGWTWTLTLMPSPSSLRFMLSKNLIRLIQRPNRDLQIGP